MKLEVQNIIINNYMKIPFKTKASDVYQKILMIDDEMYYTCGWSVKKSYKIIYVVVVNLLSF